jgi:hypothetical protein
MRTYTQAEIRAAIKTRIAKSRKAIEEDHKTLIETNDTDRRRRLEARLDRNMHTISVLVGLASCFDITVDELTQEPTP